MLLAELKVTDLILTGVTTDICILSTAHDAYMRGFGLLVPADCTSAVKDVFHKQALDLLKRNADADVRLSPWIIPTVSQKEHRTAK